MKNNDGERREREERGEKRTETGRTMRKEKERQ